MLMHKSDIQREVKIPENKEIKFEEEELLKKKEMASAYKVIFYRDLSKLTFEEKNEKIKNIYTENGILCVVLFF